MSDWLPIETAPKTPSLNSTKRGPTILLWEDSAEGRCEPGIGRPRGLTLGATLHWGAAREPRPT